MADVVANPLTLILRNMKERVSIEVRDSQHALVDPTVLTLRVTDLADRPILVDQFPAFTLTGTFSTTAGSTLVTGTGSNLGDELNPGAQVTVNGQPLEVQAVRGRAQFIATAPAVGTATGLSVNKTTRIVRQDTGRYYIDWGPATRETGHPGTLAFVWQATDNTGDMSTVAQTARIVTTRTLTLLPGFRKLIDKSVKLVDDEDCFLGYTDAQLVQYLEEGLTLINAYQPYPTFCTLDHFPLEYLHVLQEAALVAGVTSQTLFAIDTDIPSYCFVAGTDVTLGDGSRRAIEDLQLGDTVLDRKGAPQTVEAAWSEGTPEEVVKLTLWGGRTLEVTDNHRMPVWAWPRTCACDCGEPVRPGKMFKHGHHARMRDNANTSGVLVRGGGPTAQRLPDGYDPHREMEAGDIRAGDFLMIPRRFDAIEPTATSEEARLLGYYVAEGHRMHDCKNIGLTFGLHERDTWVKDATALLDGLGVRYCISKDRNANALYIRTKNGTRRRKGVQTSATDLVDFVDAHVSGRKAPLKALSTEVMRWPLELKQELLRGMLRGDGHQNWQELRGGWTFSVWYNTTSKVLADQVELLFAQLGIPCRWTYDRPKTKIIRGMESKSSGCYKLGVSGWYAKELADYVWGEQSAAGNGESRRAGWSMPRHECMVDDDFIYVPVKRAERVVNQKEVHNLTVSGDHSYLACGLGVFNSDQGNSFVIDHGTKLAAFLNTVSGRLDRIIPQMKLHFVRTGSLHIQAGTNFRLAQLLQASPNGAVFRNVFFRGS